MIDPQTVAIAEPLPEGTSDIEVVARIEGAAVRLSDILQALPPGTRSKQDIDAQVAEERAAWDR
jgi:hypothetical protein